MIRLSKNEYSKVFLLSRSQKTYNLKLEKQIPIYQISEPSEPSEPSELEFPKPHISNNRLHKNIDICWIFLILVFIIVIWMINHHFLPKFY